MFQRTIFTLALMLMVVEADPDAKRLYDDLLSHYNRLIRPVSNNSQVGMETWLLTYWVLLGYKLSYW